MKANSKNITLAVVVVLLAAIALWFWSLRVGDASAPPELPPVGAPAKRLPNGPDSIVPGISAARGGVAPPVRPAAQAKYASQSAPAAILPPATAVDSHTPEELRAVRNNLRLLGAAAQQLMKVKGLSQAGYYDVVGRQTDSYIRSVEPVMGENYSGLVVHQTDTQIEIVAPDGTSVTYDL